MSSRWRSRRSSGGRANGHGLGWHGLGWHGLWRHALGWHRLGRHALGRRGSGHWSGRLPRNLTRQRRCHLSSSRRNLTCYWATRWRRYSGSGGRSHWTLRFSHRPPIDNDSGQGSCEKGAVENESKPRQKWAGSYFLRVTAVKIAQNRKGCDQADGNRLPRARLCAGSVGRLVEFDSGELDSFSQAATIEVF
jgi:hypothetical protein